MYPFPLRVHSSGRYLIDSTGQPHFLHVDTAWSGIAQPTLTEIRQYLDDRAARGFNATIWNLIEHKFTTHTPAWANANGDLPFDASNHFDQPNAAYFDAAVTYVNEAAKRAICVLLVPAYLGFSGTDEGWYDDMLTQTTGAMRTYGQYVGTRFKDCANVIYCMGGDRTPADVTRTQQVAAGILDNDTGKVFTAHCAPGDPPASIWSAETWMAAGSSLNNTYTKDANEDVSYVDGVVEQARSPARPWVNLENRYEGGPSFDNATDFQQRSQFWWNVLSGACGHTFGHSTIWQFSAGWASFLGTTQTGYLEAAKKIYVPRRWFGLTPDTSHVWLTSGLGTSGNTDWAISSASTAEGGLLVAYVPTARAVTIDATKFKGPFHVKWIDPTNGAITNVTQPRAPYPNLGTRSIAGNGTNAGGVDGDWVLVCEFAKDVTIAPWPIPKTINAVRR